MSDDPHEAEKARGARKRPPESPSRRLTDKVSFYEKVWTGTNIPAGEFEETATHTFEEGDLASGLKTVKFERITVKKTVKEVAGKSRTPSEEKFVEDSAYQTESFGNGLPYSKSSSITSLTGRFPSEESLSRVSSSREQSKDDWDSNSNSSKITTSSSEWYNEYRTQSFQQKHISKEYFRSKSEYDNHIATIRG